MFKFKPKNKDGIFFFPIRDHTTKSVVDFYDVDPFPNYEFNENKASLLRKGDRN